MFSVKNKHIIITGAGGVIGSSIAAALAQAGAILVILDYNGEKLMITKEKIDASGNSHIAFTCDVFDIPKLEEINNKILDKLGHIDALINVAGGASIGASTKSEFLTSETAVEDSFFGINISDFQQTSDLNFMGSVIPAKVFCESMVRRTCGNIINISSMGAIRPLTKSPAYCAGKAAITNFTMWLAVHLAKSNIRVNAIAPGFFLTEQNRFLLFDEKSGELTPRGKRIVEHTPLGRLGDPEDLVSTVFWLLSDRSSFVTGSIIAVDGGFSAFSGI